MANIWDKIPQTHRAILFEKFTHPADTSAKNLCSILDLYDDNFDPSNNEMHKDIEKKLEVRSFNEFLEKFQPKVFECVTGTENDVPFFQYTDDPMEAKKNNGREIKITSHAYYEMLVNMYTQKGDSGIANIEFNDEKIREILTPKREIEALYDTRQKIPLLMEKYDERLAKNENAAPIAKRLKAIRRNALEQLKNPRTLMAISLDDTERKINAADEKLLQLKAAESNSDGEPKKLLSGRGGFDQDGHWILIPAKASTPDSDESSDAKSDPDGDNATKFAKIIQGDLNKHAADESNFTKALVVSAYTGRELANPFENKDSTALAVYRAELVENKKIIQNSFKQAQEAFIKVLSDSVRKMLCVKIFFDHATVGKGGDDAKLPKVGLIVANCKADKLIDNKIKSKFESTMQHLGLGVSDKNKLWFAILPHVFHEDFSDGGGGASQNADLDDDLYDDDDNQDTTSANGTDFSAATTILRIMEDCKIMTVFNFASTSPSMTFSGINSEVIKKLEDELAPLNYEHAVYALPNFTIMKEGTVSLGKKNETDAPKISVPAMYIDAAYVAAGLLIAAQQPEFWINNGFKDSFIKENSCVRIDLEEDKITAKLLTKFNRERSIAWSADVINAFTANRFGFAFDGDQRYDERADRFINRTYILNARTLKRKDGEYQAIFRTLMKDFIKAYLKTYGSKPKAPQRDDFLNKVVAEWKQQSKKYKSKGDIINLMLRDGEDISKEENTSNLKVELSGGEELLDIEIVD